MIDAEPACTKPGPALPADGAGKADARDLLRWYDRHRRDLPWRAKPGEAPDPYRVWLSRDHAPSRRRSPR